MKKSLLFIFILFLYANIYSQNIDTNKSVQKIIVENIIPASLITTGIIIDNSSFEKNLETNLRNVVGNSFEFKIDNYIQYAPIAEMYIADILKVKAKNHWFDQTKYLLISNIFSSLLTHGLKRLTKKTRPNGSPFSFPSGHTTFAFTNATVLLNEYKNTSLLFAGTGYLFSTTTGIFRMLNNKHWLSDVLVGAGIGIATTELVYYFEPLKNFNPFKKSKNISFIPVFSYHYNGFLFCYNF